MSLQTFSSVDRRRMYSDLAWTWPIISPPEEYKKETEEFIRLIKAHAKNPVRKVLNLGCGGGHNDHTLKKHFSLTGVDISQDMLGLARALNPEVMYVHGDMRSVRLGEDFDAVTVFDSIGYMRTVDSLRSAFHTACAHLRPGGVFITHIEESKESFVQNSTFHRSRSSGDVEISFIENYYDPDTSDTWYEANFIYLIRRSGDLTIETDCHLLGLFDMKTWQEVLRDVACEVHQTTSPQFKAAGKKIPILIGVKKN
jgi:SAM-dependent methyltransferase